MNEYTKPPPGNWREGRRLRAWELFQDGWKQKDIAEALGVSQGAVSQWLKVAREGGEEALRHRKGGGPKPRLTAAQMKELPQVLAAGAEHYGFRGQIWTRKRVAVVIKQVFGFEFSQSHVGVLLRQIGWSLQKPIQRASQRDEQAIAQWRQEKWQEIEKKPMTKDER